MHRLIFMLAALLLARAAQPQRPPPDPRFGAIEAFWMPDAAYEARVGWERVLFDWSQIQPEGPESWNGLYVRGIWLQNAIDAQREVVGIVKNTPAWATDGALHSGVPRGLYLPVDDPGNLWAGFLRRLVEAYRPYGIRRWIIWNEPDIDAQTYGHEFEGSVEDYYRLVKVAHQAVHQVDPGAQIHLGGLTYWHDVNHGRPLYLGRFLQAAQADPEAAANGYFFDVVSLHIYFRSETVFTIVREMQQVMLLYGVEKPIWINETNTSPNLDPEWPVARPQYQVTLAQQAAYIVQASALALAAGAERLAVYKFADGYLPEGAESFGLIRADGTRRPAFGAFQTGTAQFAGVYDARLHVGRYANAVTLLRRDGQTLYVLWATGDRPVTAHVETEGAVPLDMLGNELEENDEGYILAPAACSPADGCPVGGPPLVFVHRGDPAPVTLRVHIEHIEDEDAPIETLDTAHPTPEAPRTPTPRSPTPTAAPTRTPRPTLTPPPAARW